MIGLKITFLNFGYHATPWWEPDPNLGLVEYPPSPWRILRAFIAVWHRKLRYQPEEEIRFIISELASDLPVFVLPRATMGHLRHFMPKFNQSDRARIFDAFLMPRGSLIVIWQKVNLSPRMADVLRTLARAMSYFGRAESLCEADLLDHEACVAQSEKVNSWPLDRVQTDLHYDVELVRVLAPLSAREFEIWFTGLPARTKQRVLAPIRPQARVDSYTVFDALHSETDWVRKSKWNRPPGSKWVDYTRPRDILGRIDFKRITGRKRMRDLPRIARFAVVSDTKGGGGAPLLTNALFVAENMRKALMQKSQHILGYVHEIFAGKNEHGQPLSGHNHVFVLPIDEDGDGFVDHIILHAAAGFPPETHAVLASVRKLFRRGSRTDLLVLLTGLGQPENFGGHDYVQGQSVTLARAKHWLSVTPFVLSRHPKLRRDGTKKLDGNGTWIDGPLDQLLRELNRRGFPRPRSVWWMPGYEPKNVSGKIFRWLEFARVRPMSSAKPATGRGYGFAVEFPTEVEGPIALGYGCHFGLGQFRACTVQEWQDAQKWRAEISCL